MRAKVIPIRRVQGSPQEMTDEALLAACATGETAALGALFDRHCNVVTRFLAGRSGTDQRDLEDLVQDTFVNVQRSAARFDGRSTVKTWIIGIANNVARHYVRSEVRRKNLAGAVQAHALSAGDDLDHARAAQDRRIALRAAMRHLPPKLNEAFVLVYQEGLSGAEAAAVIGCREGTVWKRLHQARSCLRDILQGGEQ